MADNIPFSAGGGAVFKTDGLIKVTLPSGQTGSLLSLPEVAGKSYRIQIIACNESSTQAGISLIRDGVLIEDESTVVATGLATFSAGSFRVQPQTDDARAPDQSGNYYTPIECESFEIIKNTGNTGINIYVSYEVGEYA